MYVVFGVSGNTGKVVADTLLAGGHAVRVVVRDAAKGAAFAARGAEVAVADVTDAAAVERALAGAKGAYVLLPPDYASHDNLGDKRRQIDALATAIRASAIPHVVLLSSIGAQHPDGTGPIQSVHHAEVRFAVAGAKVTAIRAPYFMENWGAVLGAVTSQGVLPAMFTRKIPMIATRDIGALGASLLVEGPASAGVVELHGPEEHDPASVARTLSSILGREIQLVLVPPEARVGALTGGGLTEDLAKLFVEMNGAIDSGRVAFDGKGRKATGKTPLEAVLRAMLGK